MQDTAALQGSPASLPLHRRTLHQIMCDPTLSCQARVVIGMMHPPLLMHGRLQISNEEIAQALGYSYREAQRATAELEEAQIIISKRGGRAAKYYALGPAIVGGDNDGQTIYYVASEQKDVHRSDVSATTVIL